MSALNFKHSRKGIQLPHPQGPALQPGLYKVMDYFVSAMKATKAGIHQTKPNFSVFPFLTKTKANTRFRVTKSLQARASNFIFRHKMQGKKKKLDSPTWAIDHIPFSHPQQHMLTALQDILSMFPPKPEQGSALPPPLQEGFHWSAAFAFLSNTFN